MYLFAIFLILLHVLPSTHSRVCVMRVQALVDAGSFEWGVEKASANDERWELMFGHLMHVRVLYMCNTMRY